MLISEDNSVWMSARILIIEQRKEMGGKARASGPFFEFILHFLALHDKMI